MIGLSKNSHMRPNSKEQGEAILFTFMVFPLSSGIGRALMLDEFQRSDRTTSDVDFYSTVRTPIDP